MPEMEIEVIDAKNRAEIRRMTDKQLDSKYVEMEPVKAQNDDEKTFDSQFILGGLFGKQISA
jgi:hypothetical protein